GEESAPYHGWGLDGVAYFLTDREGADIDIATIPGFVAGASDLWTAPVAIGNAASVVVKYHYPADGGEDGCVFSLYDASGDNAITLDAAALLVSVTVGGEEVASIAADGEPVGDHSVVIIASAGGLHAQFDGGAWQTASL